MAGEQERGSGDKREGAKEIAIVVGLLLAVVAGTLATVWTSADRPAGADARASTPTAAVDTPRLDVVVAAASRSNAVTVGTGPVYHADVYFDFKSTRLRADAARVLQDKVALMEPGSAWGVLVQGHADLHGPAEYNRGLAQRRAEVVKRFLVELGVPEASVRLVTIGQDGALCDDASPECQQLNRRVHIEIRKLPGAAAVPASATEGGIVGAAAVTAPAFPAGEAGR